MQELAWNLLIRHFFKNLVFGSCRTDVGAYEKIGMESLYGSEAWSCVIIYSSAFEVSITGVLVACAV